MTANALKHALERVETLDCWTGPAVAEPLGGGITNRNFIVRDDLGSYVVRLGADIAEHGIMRFNERAAAKAAEAAGVSPQVIHMEPGALVMRYVEGRTLSAHDMRQPDMALRAVDLIAQGHRMMPQFLRGPLLTFWPFHVVRDYAATLMDLKSPWRGALSVLLTKADRLERAIGPIDLVFAHNDLLAANFIDDGARLWLIDWDYAGFNSPLFDIANFATNSELDETQEREILLRYFGQRSDEMQWRAYCAMRCMSLLRETFWSMVSEIRSQIDFDYRNYTQDYLGRFETAFARFAALEPHT